MFQRVKTCSLVQQAPKEAMSSAKGRDGKAQVCWKTISMGKNLRFVGKNGGTKYFKSKDEVGCLSSIFRPRFSNRNQHPKTKKSNFKVSMKCKDSSFWIFGEISNPFCFGTFTFHRGGEPTSPLSASSLPKDKSFGVWEPKNGETRNTHINSTR